MNPAYKVLRRKNVQSGRFVRPENTGRGKRLTRNSLLVEREKEKNSLRNAPKKNNTEVGEKISMGQHKNKETEDGCGCFCILLIFGWIWLFGIGSFFQVIYTLLNMLPVLIGAILLCYLIGVAVALWDILKYVLAIGFILGILFLGDLVVRELIHFIGQHWILCLSLLSVVIFLFFLASLLNDSDAEKSEERKEISAGKPSSEEKIQTSLEHTPQPLLCGEVSTKESQKNKTEDLAPDYRHSPNYGKIIQKRRG